MIQVLLTLFVLLHGIVHLLYFGQSMQFFKLQSELTWPDGSWAFSNVINVQLIRQLGGVLMVISAALFITGSIALLSNQYWYRLALIVASIFSTLIYIILWDGKFQRLHDKGFVGVLINLAIIAGVFIFD